MQFSFGLCQTWNACLGSANMNNRIQFGQLICTARSMLLSVCHTCSQHDTGMYHIRIWPGAFEAQASPYWGKQEHFFALATWHFDLASVNTFTVTICAGVMDFWWKIGRVYLNCCLLLNQILRKDAGHWAEREHFWWALNDHPTR